MSGDNPLFDDPLTQTLTISTSYDKGATWREESKMDDLYGFPWAISFPSEKVVYILCSEQIIKFTLYD
jgi:hypothetical protein